MVRPGVREISPVSIYGEVYGGKDLKTQKEVCFKSRVKKRRSDQRLNFLRKVNDARIRGERRTASLQRDPRLCLKCINRLWASPVKLIAFLMHLILLKINHINGAPVSFQCCTTSIYWHATKIANDNNLQSCDVMATKCCFTLVLLIYFSIHFVCYSPLFFYQYFFCLYCFIWFIVLL